MAQTCIPLTDSTECPSFSAASITTDDSVASLFPFLYDVTDTASFDSSLRDYISRNYTQRQYQELLGCSNVNLDNTTDFYARYTTSVLCNTVVQNSVSYCGLTGDATRPLCADSCAEFAQNEQEIVASNICGTSRNSDVLTQIRADFTNCALPANSLTQSCIQATENQPDDCGFTDNLVGLFVAAASLATPVTLTVSQTATTTATPTGLQTSGADTNNGLSKGAIAGIAVGSILGALLLLGLVIIGCLLVKRRRDRSPATSVFNQPAPGRAQPEMAAYNDGSRDYQERAGLAILPGGRVARMTALEGDAASDHDTPYTMAAYAKDTSEEEDTPESRLAPPPKRSGSLSSGSQLAVAGVADVDTSPSSGAEYTSPESQGQSEQLGFFKDYYSQDEIRPGDLVSTLWAYEPRAADEFQLERGDMIKVIGIWDDGWATGVRVRQRAEDWRPEGKVQRDSGLSAPPDTSDEGEVKAFPLVCVCLPQHWRKTIEGDSTQGSGPGGYPERGS
ncbi:hypothetical protein PRZ48_014424 [Zasmidium cellare]|uniref:SH3 domain-containing protein n=1 Tax=Zasmidium cellare TaxID=395010 RepID=A0ABR0DYW0_ZASCE|nr:hypothetical protein PRZ48_014424 [Zasmidium cellare]